MEEEKKELAVGIYLKLPTEPVSTQSAFKYSQLKWLENRGDRDLNDLKTDEDGRLYVEMNGVNNTIKKVYLPD